MYEMLSFLNVSLQYLRYTSNLLIYSQNQRRPCRCVPATRTANMNSIKCTCIIIKWYD